MGNIVITTSGTLGDHLPLIALGEHLKNRGHRVCLAASEPMLPYARKAGLEAEVCGPTRGQAQAQSHADAWNHWTRKPDHDAPEFTAEPDGQQRFERLHIAERYADLCRACTRFRADLLLCSPLQGITGAMVHEKLQIPWIMTSVTPFLHARRTPQTADAASPPEPSLSGSLPESFYRWLEKLRTELGLDTFPVHRRTEYFESQRILLGASRIFCGDAIADDPRLSITGFWFYEDPGSSRWEPNSDLRAFVESEPAPVVLSFSSLPLSDPGQVLAVHARGVARAGRRLLVQSGWAGFSPAQLPEDVDRSGIHWAGFMPQDWLFSRAAAVIHHGGIGTLARAIRQGCPMIVEPYGNDQFFNAKRALLLGAGVALHPGRLTEMDIERVLNEKILPDTARLRVRDLARRLRSEDGPGEACDLIGDAFR